MLSVEYRPLLCKRYQCNQITLLLALSHWKANSTHTAELSRCRKYTMLNGIQCTSYRGYNYVLF